MTSASSYEHIIKCSICGRRQIGKDWVNIGVAFLSHLMNDHEITYIPQQMTESKVLKKVKERHNQEVK